MTKTQLQHKWTQYYQQLHTQASDPATLYLQSLAPTGRRSVTCLLHTAAAILHFDGALETMPWSLVDFQQLTIIRNSLQKQGKSANTINLTLAALRGISKHCFSLRLISAEQWLLVQTIKPVRGQCQRVGNSLTLPQINRLHRVCSQDKTLAGKRDHALIALMLATGLRRSEVSALELGDYDRKTGLLLIKVAKGNQQRTVYLNSDCRHRLRSWLDVRGNAAGALFHPINKQGVILPKHLSSESIYHIVKTRCAHADIPGIRPHDLRRTFVTQLLAAGIDLNTTRQLVGHADIQTTARYDLRHQKAQHRALKQLYQ